MLLCYGPIREPIISQATLLPVIPEIFPFVLNNISLYCPHWRLKTNYPSRYQQRSTQSRCCLCLPEAPSLWAEKSTTQESLGRLSISNEHASSIYYVLNAKYIKLLWLQLTILLLWSFVITICVLYAQRIDGKLSRLTHNKIMVDITQCTWPM